MSELTFHELIDKLTRGQAEFVTTDDGQKLVTSNGLLEELRVAVFAGMENGGGGSSFGSKPPIDAGAMDLLNEITTQATEALAQVDKRPTPFGQAEHYVALFSAAVQEETMVTVTASDTLPDDVETAVGAPRAYRRKVEATAINHLRRWVSQIESFFNPPALGEIKSPCPSCGIEFTWKSSDGLATPTRVLNFHRDRATGETQSAKCSNCGVEWGPSQFEHLARVVGGIRDGESVSDVLERVATRG